MGCAAALTWLSKRRARSLKREAVKAAPAHANHKASDGAVRRASRVPAVGANTSNLLARRSRNDRLYTTRGRVLAYRLNQRTGFLLPFRGRRKRKKHVSWDDSTSTW